MIPPPPPYPPPHAPAQPLPTSSLRSRLPARLEHLDLELPVLPPPPLLDDTPLPHWKKVVALFSYEASKPEHLSVTEGDVIYLTGRHDNGWCEGVLNSKRGFFPKDYVQSCD